MTSASQMAFMESSNGIVDAQASAQAALIFAEGNGIVACLLPNGGPPNFASPGEWQTRGFCPSCIGRRMADTAGQLVDFVFPSVSIAGEF